MLTAKDEHALHSPFLFNLYNEVICDENPYYVFEQIEGIRSMMLKSNKSIQVEDFGAGKGGIYSKKISAIANTSVKEAKYAQLLFRLVNFFKPHCIIELGTSLGISTMYLASPDKKSMVYSFEGSKEIANIAQLNFNQLKLSNIQLVIGNMDECLEAELYKLKQIDFAFMDGNHSYQATLSYFNTILKQIHDNSVLIFDDIYWSKEMTLAWEEIKKHPQVTVSVDIFQFGIIFFKKELSKQHYKLRF